MITQVVIQNYESQKNTILNLHPGLNVLVGESDRGKSGFFRAVYKCRTNRPLGSGMRPLYWNGDGLVKVTFDNGQFVSWIQNKQGNFYQVGDSDLINAGTDVPEEIKTVFNMEEINWQSQIDRSFLMFETAGERGKTINKLSGLSKIDSTKSNAKSDINRIKAAKKIQDGLVKEYQDDLIKYKELPSADDLLREAGKLDIQIQVNRQTYITLKSNWEKKQELLKSVEKLKSLPDLEKLVLKSQKIFAEIEQNEILSRKVKLAFADKRKLESTRIDQDKLFAVTRLISKSETIFAEYKTKNQQYNNLKILIRNQNGYVQQIIDLAKKIDDLKKKIPKQCPTCGGVIK